MVKTVKHRKPKNVLKFVIDKPFSCDLCGLQESDRCRLRNHMKIKHTFDERECKICNKVFGNETKLRIHTRMIHTRKTVPENFECLICYGKNGTSYTEYKRLHKHVEKLHAEEKDKITFSCDPCGFICYSELQMEKHNKLNHSQSFVCLDANCTISFKSALGRRRHFLTYHSQDREVNFWLMSLKLIVLLIDSIILTLGTETIATVRGVWYQAIHMSYKIMLQ